MSHSRGPHFEIPLEKTRNAKGTKEDVASYKHAEEIQFQLHHPSVGGLESISRSFPSQLELVVTSKGTFPPSYEYRLRKREYAAAELANNARQKPRAGAK